MKHLIEPMDLTSQEVDEILDLAQRIISDLQVVTPGINTPVRKLSRCSKKYFCFFEWIGKCRSYWK